MCHPSSVRGSILLGPAGVYCRVALQRAAALLAATALAFVAVAAPHAAPPALQDGERVHAVSATTAAARCAIFDDPFFFDVCLSKAKR
jgi:hypothetical protein